MSDKNPLGDAVNSIFGSGGLFEQIMGDAPKNESPEQRGDDYWLTEYNWLGQRLREISGLGVRASVSRTLTRFRDLVAGMEALRVALDAPEGSSITQLVTEAGRLKREGSDQVATELRQFRNQVHEATGLVDGQDDNHSIVMAVVQLKRDSSLLNEGYQQLAEMLEVTPHKVHVNAEVARLVRERTAPDARVAKLAFDKLVNAVNESGATNAEHLSIYELAMRVVAMADEWQERALAAEAAAPVKVSSQDTPAYEAPLPAPGPNTDRLDDVTEVLVETVNEAFGRNSSRARELRVRLGVQD